MHKIPWWLPLTQHFFQCREAWKVVQLRHCGFPRFEPRLMLFLCLFYSNHLIIGNRLLTLPLSPATEESSICNSSAFSSLHRRPSPKLPLQRSIRSPAKAFYSAEQLGATACIYAPLYSSSAQRNDKRLDNLRCTCICIRSLLLPKSRRSASSHHTIGHIHSIMIGVCAVRTTSTI